MAEKSSLIDFVSQVGGEKNLRVEENLGEGFVRLRVAEAERRQAKHDIRSVEDIVVEMLRNSRDAGAQHIFVATAREANLRSIVILDDGSGVPCDMQDKIFDARVTSKLESMHMDRWGVHGRGMALFSIKENTQTAQVMSSDAGLGAAIRVQVNLDKLPEKTDQSTWPSIGRDDDGNQCIVRGPHNIVRTCCEFVLEERDRCTVYLGSMAEIAATIRAYIKPQISESNLLFIDNLDELPVLDRFYVAADAQELRDVALQCGLDLSERTSHRILSGQIAPVKNVAAKVLKLKDPQAPQEVDLLKDRRGLKITKDDIEKFSRLMEKEFEYLSSRYYLSLAKDPKVTVSKQKITVTFDIDKRD